MSSLLKIYTDGSCLGNPGAGAAAAIFVLNNTIRFSITQGCKYTNNQIEELRAAIIGLETVDMLKLEKIMIHFCLLNTRFLPRQQCGVL